MEPKEISVSDYLTAAALHASGIRYMGSRLESERVVFLFNDEDGVATKAVQSHGSGRLKVRSFDMAASVNYLKSELFGARRAGGLR